jgi:predicted nucleotidyltransferase
MVVIDEKERVPPLDEAALERLGHVLDREGVIAAMLIGSQARGTPGPLSDVDIAVWHEPGLDPTGRLRLQLELARLACRVLRTNEVDIGFAQRGAAAAVPSSHSRCQVAGRPRFGRSRSTQCTSPARLSRYQAAEGRDVERHAQTHQRGNLWSTPKALTLASSI